MVLYQRCVFQNFFLRGQKYAFQPTRKTPIPQFAFTLRLGYRGVGHNTTSEIGERTLIAVKPDGVQRRLVGIIMQRFEQRGFKLVGLKMLQAPEELLSQHYQDLRKKTFYPGLVRYMTSGPVVAMVWEGPDVVQTCRIMVGATNPAKAQPGTVRGDFSTHVSRNVVHASDSVEGAQREIQLWFNRKELMVWTAATGQDSST